MKKLFVLFLAITFISAGCATMKENPKTTIGAGAGAAVGAGLGYALGKGKGAAFLAAGLQFVDTKYRPKNITLSVAAFNKRAINLYEKLGFRKVESFVQVTNGGQYEFVKMVYKG